MPGIVLPWQTLSRTRLAFTCALPHKPKTLPRAWRSQELWLELSRAGKVPVGRGQAIQE